MTRNIKLLSVYFTVFLLLLLAAVYVVYTQQYTLSTGFVLGGIIFGFAIMYITERSSLLPFLSRPVGFVVIFVLAFLGALALEFFNTDGSRASITVGICIGCIFYRIQFGIFEEIPETARLNR
jgi:hypothetical protein